TSHTPAEGRQTVVFGANVLGGQAALLPVHVSATSHTPAEGRQTVVFDAKVSGGKAGVLRGDVAATSHTPTGGRGTGEIDDEGARGGGAAGGVRRERVGRTGGAAARARLRHVAYARRGTADGGVRRERVGRTGGAAARARLRHVAYAGRGTAHGGVRREGVCRTVGATPSAGLRHVAYAGRGSTDGRAREELVGWTLRAGRGARLGDVAHACRRPADHARGGPVLAGAGRTGVGGARIAVVALRRGGAWLAARDGSTRGTGPVVGADVVRRARVAVAARHTGGRREHTRPLPDAVAGTVARRGQRARRGLALHLGTAVGPRLAYALLDRAADHKTADAVAARAAGIDRTGGPVTDVVAVGAAKAVVGGRTYAPGRNR